MLYNSIKINLFQFTLYSLNLVSFDAFQSKVDEFLCWIIEQEAFKKDIKVKKVVRMEQMCQILHYHWKNDLLRSTWHISSKKIDW